MSGQIHLTNYYKLVKGLSRFLQTLPLVNLQRDVYLAPLPPTNQSAVGPMINNTGTKTDQDKYRLEDRLKSATRPI
jgi:hypothetical protein